MMIVFLLLMCKYDDFSYAEAAGWTSWELYNFALIGLTNELIELGASANIKMTVLQLWARYLGKLEVAFMSTKKKLVPKLSRRYKKRLLHKTDYILFAFYKYFYFSVYLNVYNLFV